MTRLLGAIHLPTGERLILDTPLDYQFDHQSISWSLQCILHRDFHIQIKHIYKSGFYNVCPGTTTIRDFCNILATEYTEQFELLYE